MGPSDGDPSSGDLSGVGPSGVGPSVVSPCAGVPSGEGQAGVGHSEDCQAEGTHGGENLVETLGIHDWSPEIRSLGVRGHCRDRIDPRQPFSTLRTLLRFDPRRDSDKRAVLSPEAAGHMFLPLPLLLPLHQVDVACALS